MKKLYTLLLVLSVCSHIAAQRPSLFSNVKNNSAITTVSSVIVTPYDTLSGPSWSNANAGGPALYIYSTSGGGYVSGNNIFGDLQLAQSFEIANSMDVVGALYWFAAKKTLSGDTSSKITLKMFNMNGAGTTSSGPSTSAPNSILASYDIPISALDTSLDAPVFTVWNFPTPVSVTSNFALGVDFTGLSDGDTCGLISSTHGDAGGAELPWVQIADGTWNTQAWIWGIDYDLYIFAIVDQNTGINEFHKGLKMYQNSPNPFSASTTINYELENAADDVILRVFDLNGRMLKTINLNSQQAGNHVIELDGSEFASGEYIFSLSANGKNLTKKMTVIH
ncbi:MAG: T9SS type A sorting domain-containing protein [Bacteroidetes bacterium]|nr:T9SS type A sorting domain-containing protein [Bacteroidota bacterium]